MDDKEFLDSLRILDNSEDCPDDLIKMAKSPFEKVVCIEFFKLYKEFQTHKAEQKADMKWLKWLISGVFSVTVVTLLFQLVRTFCFGL